LAECILAGIDIGTTGCRAEAYRQDGALVISSALEYPLYTPQAGWAEQDPEETWRCFIKVTLDVTRECARLNTPVAGLCFSSVFHSLMPVDAAGAPLHRLLVWADQRSQPQAEKIKQELEAAAIYARTGCPIHPMYPLAKILWFRQERPEIFRQAYHFISIKEFILRRLLGKYIVDRSIASGSGFYNNQTQDWDSELLAYLGIEATQLSPIAATTHIETGMPAEIAIQLNLPSATPVILGAGDGVLSNIGSGAVNQGQMTAMIGTSGAVRVFRSKPATDPQGRTWCYNATDSIWMLGGAINNGGIAFRWMRDKFAETEQRVAEKLELDVYEIMSRYAAKVPAGSDGLLVLPFFTGERSPYWNADARGVIFGLNLNHSKRHLLRATLEGVAFRMFSIYEALTELSGPMNEIRASGSFIRSRIWVQIMADVFGQTITVPGEPQGAAFGATILGSLALGQIRDIREVGNFINIQERYQPNTVNHARYQDLYTIYKRVYHNLQAEFSAIADIQRNWK
jgi:gluconokinase